MRLPYLLTAALAISTATVSAQDTVDQNIYGYLNAHVSAHGKWVAFATSQDAIHFHDILCADAMLPGSTDDVYVTRAHDGKSFIMITSGLNIRTSTDLINWKECRVELPSEANGASGAQIIWDDEKGAYMLYFSMPDSKGVSKVFHCYIDEDLTAAGEVSKLIEWGHAEVEADIVMMPAKSKYQVMLKDPSMPGFYIGTSDSLSGPWTRTEYIRFEGDTDCNSISAFQLADGSWEFTYVEQTGNPMDYRISKADKDLRRFSMPQPIEGIYGPGKGSFVSLTKEEYDRLQAWSDAEEPKHLAKDVNNPIFPALHADPEVLYSEQTGKYYIYPTTDGAYGWHSFDFHCLSSEDFKTWKDEGVILDLRDLTWGDREYAWAPCIIEKPVYSNAKQTKIKGYKYYFYFVHHGTIGVAVADRPEGPFKDVLGKALLTQEEIHAPNQIIDPDVFRDPVSGKYYLYWGNSYLWMAELADDMISLVPGTMHELIPRSRIGEYHYLEGSYVFERNGLYYFMWSENITRSSYYRVRYLISESPTEFIRNGQPAKVEETIVIQQDPSLQIFGTGHHSVICMPGTDDWYIVYHRFTRPEGVKMGLSGGYNREVCIDRMYFNPDGTIRPVKPTL